MEGNDRNSKLKGILLFLLVCAIIAMAYHWHGKNMKDRELRSRMVSEANTATALLGETIDAAEKTGYKAWKDHIGALEFLQKDFFGYEPRELGDYEDIYDMISFVSVLYDPDKQDKEFLHKLKDINFDLKSGKGSEEIYIKFADKNDKKMVRDYIKKNKAKSDSKINE